MVPLLEPAPDQAQAAQKQPAPDQAPQPAPRKRPTHPPPLENFEPPVYYYFFFDRLLIPSFSFFFFFQLQYRDASVAFSSDSFTFVKFLNSFCVVLSFLLLVIFNQSGNTESKKGTINLGEYAKRIAISLTS
jgi:hypothetical protein